MNIVLVPALVIPAVFVIIALLAPFAKTLGLIDKPNHRKRHDEPIAMVGGLAIYLFVISVVILFEPSDKILWLMFSMSILVVIGALDDAMNLGVRIRFVSQIVATSAVIFGLSLWIRSLGLGLEAVDNINQFWGVSITLIAVIGLINAFNMVDGIDGLAAGHMLVGLGTVGGTLIIIHGAIYQLLWFTALASAVFAFWVVNLSLTPIKRVFLGDAGSTLLGFVMAWILIYYTQEPLELLHPIVALWCVTIPVYDTMVVITRRLKCERPLFSPDRNHLHHILVDNGWSPRSTLWMILLTSLSLNTFGVWVTIAISPLASLGCYLLFLLIFGYVMFHPSLTQTPAAKNRLIR